MRSNFQNKYNQKNRKSLTHNNKLMNLIIIQNIDMCVMIPLPIRKAINIPEADKTTYWYVNPSIL